jgi:predicted nucleic acid-binding Zn ribbon protein
MKRLGSGRGDRGSDQPHPLASALEAVRAEVAPQTLLASVQETWPAVAGATVAAQADPVSEREGVVTIACRSATWAQELDLMQGELLPRMREALAEGPFADRLEGLRFTADAARTED